MDRFNDVFLISGFGLAGLAMVALAVAGLNARHRRSLRMVILPLMWLSAICMCVAMLAVRKWTLAVPAGIMIVAFTVDLATSWRRRYWPS